jgi:hypothetical protein
VICRRLPLPPLSGALEASRAGASEAAGRPSGWRHVRRHLRNVTSAYHRLTTA